MSASPTQTGKWWLIFLLALFVFTGCTEEKILYATKASACSVIGDGYAESHDGHFLKLAKEIGGKLAPGGQIILCVSNVNDPSIDTAFTFVHRDNGGTIDAWGIAIGASILRESDDELKGLIAHEIAHNATKRYNCDDLSDNRYVACEKEVDDYGATLVGSCTMLQFLRGMKQEVGMTLNDQSEFFLEKRIDNMVQQCLFSMKTKW